MLSFGSEQQKVKTVLAFPRRNKQVGRVERFKVWRTGGGVEASKGQGLSAVVSEADAVCSIRTEKKLGSVYFAPEETCR